MLSTTGVPSFVEKVIGDGMFIYFEKIPEFA